MNTFFARNFSEILRLRGINQKQFAELLGVTPSAVNQWAKGKREPCFSDLVKICTLLEVDFNELMGQYLCTLNKQAILRDIIGSSATFQKEQRHLQDEMHKNGYNDIEIVQACEQLYLQYYKKYQEIFHFTD